ncbi:polysaccharide deacetylase family protein [Negadavirga shengliensis]|uniref:Polysaccharide deacetylase family protein n=1 Tax=Negadavirga shengliensis TaxID=1389218 RepID=A0ABV9T871_9BACT
MTTNMMNYPLLLLLFFGSYSLTQAQDPPFPWPDGKRMAISLSFDDARASNPTLGVPLLNEYDVKATFFIVPSNVEKM